MVRHQRGRRAGLIALDPAADPSAASPQGRQVDGACDGLAGAGQGSEDSGGDTAEIARKDEAFLTFAGEGQGVTDRPASSPSTVPSAVVRLAAGALPAEALAVLAGPVGEAVARAAGYAGRALSENTRRTSGEELNHPEQGR